MPKRTAESERLLEELLKSIRGDGLTSDMLDEPLARILVALRDPEKLKEARFLECARAFEYLLNKRQLLQGKPDSITERRVIKEYSDQKLEELIRDHEKRLGFKPEQKDPDPSLH